MKKDKHSTYTIISDRFSNQDQSFRPLNKTPFGKLSSNCEEEKAHTCWPNSSPLIKYTGEAFFPSGSNSQCPLSISTNA